VEGVKRTGCPLCPGVLVCEGASARFLFSARHPAREILAPTPSGRVTRLRRFSFAPAAGGRSALRPLAGPGWVG
jgi:hypothetical protein